MSGGLLRERTPGQHARVTYLELFFDLVFVFAITQISHALLKTLTPVGALQAGFLLLAVWWGWIYTAWVTNWLDPEHPAVRVLLFALMATGLLLSTSLDDAFDGRALPFALAYVVLQLGRTLFMLWAVRGDEGLRRNFQRVTCWLTLSAVFWIAGGLAAEPMRWSLWAIALGLDYLSVALGFWVPGLKSSHTEDWTVEGAHLAERCGLFVIICLGESILVTGATFAGLTWTGPVVAAATSAFLGSVAIWWIYFSAHAEAAAEAIARSSDPGRIARMAYTYVHIPLIAGIVVTAAGDELALAHPEGHVEPMAALVLIGGPALFLLGAALFKFSVFRVISASRLTGVVLLLALAPLAHAMTPLGLSALATGALGLVAVWETVLRMRQSPGMRALQTALKSQ